MSNAKVVRALKNRMNALKSTGPKTPEGKMVSAKNAVKHGILAVDCVLESESQRKFNGLEKRLMAELAPVGEMEVILASRIVTLVWRLRRVGEIELGMMETHFKKAWERVSAIEKEMGTARVTLGDVFAWQYNWDDAYSKLRRYEGQIDRALYRVMHELERRQMVRHGKEVAAPGVVDVNVEVSEKAA